MKQITLEPAEVICDRETHLFPIHFVRKQGVSGPKRNTISHKRRTLKKQTDRSHKNTHNANFNGYSSSERARWKLSMIHFRWDRCSGSGSLSTSNIIHTKKEILVILELNNIFTITERDTTI